MARPYLELFFTKTKLIEIITRGRTGAAGRGVPVGGNAGQILEKATGDDYDTRWTDPTGGGGAVESVNGKAGVVILDPDDLDDQNTIHKFVLQADLDKLAGIEGGATANQSDAYLLARANHTGFQLAATISDFSTAVDARITAQKGQANGLAPLGGDGKLSVSYLPYSVLGATIYQGVWNATTNTPALTSGVGTKGHYYVVNVAGATNLDGVTDWKLGDWAIFNGTAWEKVDNTDAVLSVNGLTGAVVLTTSNIAEGSNLYFTNARAQTAVELLTIVTYTNDQTLALTDRTCWVRANKATAMTITVPPNSSVAFGAGTQIPIRQVGAGQVTIAAGAGVTINTPESLKLRKAGSTVSLVKVGTDEWDLTGDLEAA